MGMYAGRKPYTLGDNLIATYNYLALAIPSFVAGIVAIYFFSFKLGWFPFNGSVGVGIGEGTWAYYMSRMHHVLLPALILGLMGTASYTQFYEMTLLKIVGKIL